MSEFKMPDPTALGLFLVAFISLPLAILQFKNEGTPAPLFTVVIGAMMIMVSIMAFVTNNYFPFVVFTLAGIGTIGCGIGIGPWESLAVGMFFFMFTVWSVILKLPKILSTIFLVTAIEYVCITCEMDLGGDYWHWIIGACAAILVILCMYLGFAMAVEDKLKLKVI